MKNFSIEGSYTELQVENGVDVTVSDMATAITITAGENVMPKVVVEKVGNKLRIHLKPLASCYGSEMKVILPYNADLINIDLPGASNIMKKVVGSRYALVCDRCEGDMSGGSNAYIHCNGSIKSNLSGGSELHYTGNASPSGCDCSGGSNVVHDVL